VEKTLLKTMLFDFYGDLLTEKQREYYDLYYNEDLSLSEIAENVGITRQGVHDIVARAESMLLETERKTGLIRRFSEMQAGLSRAVGLAEQLRSGAATKADAAAAAQLIELLNNMKV
jgi:predicted DNA-binding protein YlxM (UPF0122 family)